MKKMWVQLEDGYDCNSLKAELGEIGKVECDPSDEKKLTITFHNQSENGIRMACFRLYEDFLKRFKDFNMIS